MPLWYTEATGTQQKCIYSSSSHCSPWDFYQEHKLKMPNEERFESKCSKCHQRGLIQSTMKSAEIFQYTAIYLGLGPKSKFKPFQDFGQNDDTSKWESLGSNQSSTDKQVKITYSYESLPFFFFFLLPGKPTLFPSQLIHSIQINQAEWEYTFQTLAPFLFCLQNCPLSHSIGISILCKELYCQLLLDKWSGHRFLFFYFFTWQD